MLRQPIVTVMGHVDHGKTTLLDQIRGSAVAAKEAGGITQAIGASSIPIETIKYVCGDLLKKTKIILNIPGLLFIDTPGHAAFVNLRKRGGNLADIAVLVIDITKGVEQQTVESINVLKAYKTPFVIAANKIDALQGWTAQKGPLMNEINRQDPDVNGRFETKMYEIVGQLFEHGFTAERFDRVEDYAKQLAIVPVSAKTGSGIPELLMVIAGLAQRFLETNLRTTENGGKGTVLEVKEQKGMGKVLDVIVYDGRIAVGDTVVIGGSTQPIVTKVKALFEPAPLQDMREKKSEFQRVKEVHAATGVRMTGQGIDGVLAGMPLMVATENIETVKREVQQDVEDVLVETRDQGIIIKADTLGSLEALSYLLKEHHIPVKKASIGSITKKDLSDAEAQYEKEPLHGVILGFNIPYQTLPTGTIKTITNDVIYKLIEEYQQWKSETLRNVQLGELQMLVKPCKIQLLKGYVFRQNNPAIVGVEVLAGTLTSKTPLMKSDGKHLTTVKGIQLELKQIEQAEKGKRVALSLPNITVGRQVVESDVLYSALPEEHFRKFKEFKQYLSDDEKDLLKEIAIIMRHDNPVWGV